MEWTTIVRELGGEIGLLPALLVAALAYACWYFMQRVMELQDKRVDDAKETLSEAAKREAETITALNLINSTLQVLLGQSRGGGGN